jgi:hypothetical protein
VPLPDCLTAGRMSCVSSSVLVCRTAGSGKTALACRACDPSAPLSCEHSATIGVDYKRTSIEVEG